VSFPRVTIDAAALRHNLAAVRRLAPASRVLAVIKANGYGHGLVPTAKALITADGFGVARLVEGLELRQAGIASPIVLLEGVFSSEELLCASRERFELVVHTFEQIEMLEQASIAHRFAVWLKVNTGMNRLGFAVDEFESARRRLVACSCVGEVRLMTHLAAAEEQESDSARRQIKDFLALTEGIEAERSIANSAGVVAWPEARTEWVRPGLMLYGISPLPDLDSAQIGLRPVMTLSTQLISLRRVPRGAGVGYNAIWRAQRDSIIGIAAIGYGDGYARNVRSGAPVLVNGRPATVAGRVSMDMTGIDVTDLPDARVGDTVVLWGEGVPAESVAPYADTIAYELVCGLAKRVTVDWKD